MLKLLNQLCYKSNKSDDKENEVLTKLNEISNEIEKYKRLNKFIYSIHFNDGSDKTNIGFETLEQISKSNTNDIVKIYKNTQYGYSIMIYDKSKKWWDADKIIINSEHKLKYEEKIVIAYLKENSF